MCFEDDDAVIFDYPTFNPAFKMNPEYKLLECTQASVQHGLQFWTMESMLKTPGAGSWRFQPTKKPNLGPR